VPAKRKGAGVHASQNSVFIVTKIRTWLYTAITRAESEVHIVGGEEDFRAIIESPGSADYRNSFLEDLLRRGGSQG
jgi:ATP-dependent exoDNAse (exonuclease V) alpha subunit